MDRISLRRYNAKVAKKNKEEYDLDEKREEIAEILEDSVETQKKTILRSLDKILI